MIKKRMTGLRTVELFLYLEFYRTRLPTLGDPWITRLFSLQTDQNGLRDLKIHVYPNDEIPLGMYGSSYSDENMELAKTFDAGLQKRVKEGIEKYQRDTSHDKIIIE